MIVSLRCTLQAISFATDQTCNTKVRRYIRCCFMVVGPTDDLYVTVCLVCVCGEAPQTSRRVWRPPGPPIFAWLPSFRTCPVARLRNVPRCFCVVIARFLASCQEGWGGWKGWRGRTGWEGWRNLGVGVWGVTKNKHDDIASTKMVQIQ